MTIEAVLTLLIGGGGIGMIVSAWLTRRSAKESADIQLLDRAYREIERIDKELDEMRAENARLRKVLRDNNLI